MKSDILDIEISRLLLGELSEDEALKLKERVVSEDGNLDRIDRLRKEDEAFLARFPAPVFAAQVESGVRKRSFDLQTNKHSSKKREHKMLIGKRVLIGVAILTGAGFYANHLNTTLENEVSFVPSKIALEKKPTIAESEQPVVKLKHFDADFRSLQTRVQDGLSDEESVQAYRTFLNAHTLGENPDRVLWVYDKYASLLEKSERTGIPSAASIRTKIVEEFTNMSSDEKGVLERSKEGIAKSLFMDSEEKFLKMATIVLSSSDEKVLKNELRKKHVLMSAITKSLEAVIVLDIPRWSVASYYRLATTHIDAADAIRRSFVPPRLSTKQVLDYSKILENQAMGIEVNALGFLQKGLAIEDVQGQYHSESRILLERLKAKICPNGKEMEALHSTIWEVEHGSRSAAKTFADDIGERSGIHFPEALTFKKKVLSETPQVELLSDAERIRMETEGWVCLPQAMHDRFHKRIEEEVIPEELSRFEISDTITGARPKFDQCSENSNASNFHGSVKVSFSIVSSGSVTDVTVQSAVRKKDIGRCVQNVVSELIFPKTKKDSHRVIYPISIGQSRNPMKELGNGAKGDISLRQKALRLFSRGEFSEAIKTCATVKTQCYRILAISYKKVGDKKNACKYHRLAGIKTKDLKCD